MTGCSPNEVRAVRGAAAVVRGAGLHIPSSYERELLASLTTADDPFVLAEHADEVRRAERDEAYALVDEVRRATSQENRRASRKVWQGGSRRRIVRLRSVSRSHDPRSTFDDASDAPEVA